VHKTDPQVTEMVAPVASATGGSSPGRDARTDEQVPAGATALDADLSAHPITRELMGRQGKQQHGTEPASWRYMGQRQMQRWRGRRPWTPPRNLKSTTLRSRVVL